MLELSFLMFMVGLFFGLSLFLRRITNPYHPDRTIFYIPSPMLFNVLWGSIFYIGYGILMYQENTVRLCLGIIEIILFLYTFLMIYIKHIIKKNRAPYPIWIQKLLNHVVERQEKLDKKSGVYSQRKALKILGLPTYAKEDSEQINKGLDKLKSLQGTGKIQAPYFETIIHQTANALQTK